MKIIMTALLVVAAVSSVQARAIPLDSIGKYLVKSESIMKGHASEMGQIVERLRNPNSASYNYDQAVEAIKIATEIERSTWNIMLAASLYASIMSCDNEANTSATCIGLTAVVGQLSLHISIMRNLLMGINHQLSVVNGDAAMKHLEQFLIDILESIPSESCRTKISEKIDKLQKSKNQSHKK